MSKNPLRLKIAYLYPDILQNFCDRANICAFLRRAQLRDIDAGVVEIYSNDKIQSSKFDFYYIGGSNILSLDNAITHLQDNADELRVASISEVPMLAINCGYMLFGNFYQLHNQNKTEGIKILDIDTIAGKKHHWGNMYGICEFLDNKTIAGFENHGMLTYLNTGVSPFLTLRKGKGNNGEDKTEGARFNNVIGSYITSPILAQNPHLCDFFIATALRVKYKCRIPLTPLSDDIEWFSHNYIIESVK